MDEPDRVGAAHARGFLYPLAGLVLSFITLMVLLALRSGGSPSGLSAAWFDGLPFEEGAAYGYFGLYTTVLFVLLGCVIGRMEDRLWRSAVTDPGTHLLNRRYIDECLHRELACARHCGAALAFMIIDIDRLKAINDDHGHASGDYALRKVAACLRETCRSRDRAARWGGDEFVVLVPGSTAEQAAVLADRIRAALRRMVATDPAIVFPLSVSIGVSDIARAGAACSETLFASADRALLVAKDRGRDRVFLARRSWIARTGTCKAVRAAFSAGPEERRNEQGRTSFWAQVRP